MDFVARDANYYGSDRQDEIVAVVTSNPNVYEEILNKDKYGILLLKSRLQYCSDDHIFEILGNEEEKYEKEKILLFVNYIGLEYGIDYSQEKNLQKLRYQNMMFMKNESESKFAHSIRNFISKFFPSYTKRILESEF